MATYTLTVRIESHDADGEFYLVGDGYETAGDILESVAADHIMRISRIRYIENYLLDVLREGENASETEFESIDAHLRCGVHADVSYQQFAFWVGDNVHEIGHEPTENELASLADELR